jgi:diacylglycerol kinase (ATP)
MKEICIIINPRSGSRNQPQLLRAAHRHLWGRPVRILAPQDLAALQDLATSLDESRTEAVVVMGGDGTIHQFIRSLPAFPNRIPMIPFPAGTANDLATEIGILPDWSQIQTLLDTRSIDEVDLVTVNGIPFATTAGVGLGSRLTERFNRARNSSGLVHLAHRIMGDHIYPALAAQTILTSTNLVRRIRVRTSNFDEKLTSVAVFVCNQASLGGDLTVAPGTNNKDSRFNVLVVPDANRVKLLSQMIEMTRGSVPSEFFSFSAEHLELQDLSGKPLSVFGDGETLLEAAKLDFRIQPKALRVYAPRKAAQTQPVVRFERLAT